MLTVFSLFLSANLASSVFAACSNGTMYRAKLLMAFGGGVHIICPADGSRTCCQAEVECEQ